MLTRISLYTLVGLLLCRLDAAPGAMEGVERRSVVIFADGVRMAGDLYTPSDLKPGSRLSCSATVRAA
ncbi:MAG: hypothetical protein ACO3ND_07045 [Opitutales bacterium]